MVGHDHARSVLRAPLRHVARDAVGRDRVLAGGDQGIERVDRALGGMALPADCGIVVDGFLAAGRPMRIVAGLAGQLALRSPESTCDWRSRYTELTASNLSSCPVPGAWSKESMKSSSGSPGTIGKRSSIESLRCGGNASAGRLEVALHADFHLEFGTQARGIHDARRECLPPWRRRSRRFAHGCRRVRDSAGNRSLPEVAEENGVAAGRLVPAGFCGIPLWQNMHL